MEDLPLPSIFEQARKIYDAATESASDQDGVRKGCEALRKCEDMIGKLGLFSVNETKEDISTGNLKYIMFFHSDSEGLLEFLNAPKHFRKSFRFSMYER